MIGEQGVMLDFQIGHASQNKVNNMSTYSLELDSFAIEFDVDEEFSISETAAYERPDVPDFVFAVADIWVKVTGVRHLVISKFDTGNLIETLRALGKELRLLRALPALNGNIKIPQGGWCAWMRGYWDRIDQDCSLPDDEENYDLLIPYGLVSGRDGHFSAYLYDSVPTIEAATRGKTREALIHVWGTFDLKKLTFEVDKLLHSITLDIQECTQRG